MILPTTSGLATFIRVYSSLSLGVGNTGFEPVSVFFLKTITNRLNVKKKVNTAFPLS